MRNLAFVIWMVGYPVSTAIVNYITYLRRGKFTDGVYATAALLEIFTWIYVGTLLYEA